MKQRLQIDPELHILRSVVQKAEGRERNNLEAARFQIYAAFEAQTPENARRWCEALRAALLVWDDGEDGEIKKIAMGALKRIEAAI